MKPFRFQQFSVAQSADVFRVGTDAVLLGALASVHGKTFLEVGCGTGIISLMLAQRNTQAKITAIDINPEAVALAEKNFSESPFFAGLHVECSDFKTFKAHQFFDHIISNPPYFEPNTSEKDVVARQRTELDFSELIQHSAVLLAPDGLFSVIIPAESASGFVSEAKRAGLHLARKIDIYGIAHGPLKRHILEFSPTNRQPAVSETFIIEKSPRKYSDQYLESTRAFHVFKK